VTTRRPWRERPVGWTYLRLPPLPPPPGQAHPRQRGAEEHKGSRLRHSIEVMAVAEVAAETAHADVDVFVQKREVHGTSEER